MPTAMKFKITTLSENHVARSGKNLIAEHGLSFYIAAGKRRILFDTGQNLAIAHNAGVLDIDLSRIDAVVLSHGHYDHTSGLKSILECNCSCSLYAHPDVFAQKIKGKDSDWKYIGIPIDRDEFETKGIDLKLSRISEEIVPGIRTTGEIPLKNHFEQVEKQLSRDPRPLPQIKINPIVRDIFEFKYEDFFISDYDPHPGIKAEVAV